MRDEQAINIQEKTISDEEILALAVSSELAIEWRNDILIAFSDDADISKYLIKFARAVIAEIKQN